MKEKEIKATNIWNEEKLRALGEFITLQAQKQTQEQLLENERIALQYRIEDSSDPDLISDKEEKSKNKTINHQS